MRCTLLRAEDMVEIGLVKCKRLPDDSPPFLRRSFSHIAQINLVMLACLGSALFINKLVYRCDCARLFFERTDVHYLRYYSHNPWVEGSRP